MFNLMKTAILMAAITALFMLIGRWMGGQAGMMLALAVAAIRMAVFIRLNMVCRCPGLG